MKKVVLSGEGKNSLLLDILKKIQNEKEDFKSRKKNIITKAKIIIEKNENPFVD